MRPQKLVAMTRSGSALCAVVLLALAAAAAASATSNEDLAAQVTQPGGRALQAVKRCPKNFTFDNKKRCVCKPGLEYNKSTKKCSNCQAGFYKNASGNTACKPCPSGSYVSYKGASKCLLCKTGLIDPARTRCQRGCKTLDDRSVIHFGPFWSANRLVYYRGSSAGNLTTAADVCDNLRRVPNGATNLIPAVIKSRAEAKVASKLADFAFACQRFRDGEPYGYYAWVLKGYETPYPLLGTCNQFFHTKGALSNGNTFPLPSTRCVSPGGEYLPVLCTKGCARYCVKCNNRGRCQTCLEGFRPVNGNCKKIDVKKIS